MDRSENPIKRTSPVWQNSYFHSLSFPPSICLSLSLSFYPLFLPLFILTDRIRVGRERHPGAKSLGRTELALPTPDTVLGSDKWAHDLFIPIFSSPSTHNEKVWGVGGGEVWRGATHTHTHTHYSTPLGRTELFWEKGEGVGGREAERRESEILLIVIK